MHSSVNFTEHMLGLLKNSGTTGNSGNGSAKYPISKEKVGTTRGAPLLPLETEWYRSARATGTAKIKENQSLKKPVTSGTGGTAILQGAEVGLTPTDIPLQWHAILAGLKQRNCPDWMSPDQWSVLRSDAESFLCQWGTAAHQLGWAALDLFGVHPVAPACRFDVMGLIPMLSGRQVVAVTAGTASIRRASSLLNFKRRDQTGAVCILDVPDQRRSGE